MLTLKLPKEIESRVREEATRRGLAAEEYATNLIAESLPATTQTSETKNSLSALFAEWAAEDATDDPEELARRQKESDELMEGLARNRLEMEGPNARKLWP